MSFYFGIDFLRQPVNGVAWPVRVLVAVVAVPIAADAVLLFAPVGRVFGQKGGQDGAVVAEKGAHLLLNGQNVFAEQLGGKGGNKGGLVGASRAAKCCSRTWPSWWRVCRQWNMARWTGLSDSGRRAMTRPYCRRIRRMVWPPSSSLSGSEVGLEERGWCIRAKSCAASAWQAVGKARRKSGAWAVMVCLVCGFR